MNEKVGRNDPCPCGSGKKYKQCCMANERPTPTGGKKKFKASVITTAKSVNLIERAYGTQGKLETQETQGTEQG